MTTPDLVPGSDPVPDDATSAYDPDAAPWPPAAPTAERTGAQAHPPRANLRGAIRPSPHRPAPRRPA